jgi:hypothetical protein
MIISVTRNMPSQNGRKRMKYTTIATAAAVLIGAALSTTAMADMNYGPINNGKQCWKSAKDGINGFGYWDSCPTPAAAVVTHAPRHQRKS